MTLAVLPNFPFKNQLQEATADGYPPENARYDCVPVSFAAAIQYYDGGYVSGDALKDAEYGETYANSGTALWRYIDNATDRARATYHVNCVPYNSTDTRQLTAKVHAWLRQGYPVIATIPSAWGTAHDMATLAKSPFSTHVIVFYSEEGGLTAMNPWKAMKHTGSDAYWQGRLCDGQVWAVVKEANAMGIPTGWKDDGKTLTAPNGVPVIHGFRDFVLTYPGGWEHDNWPYRAEQHLDSIEPGNASIGAGARQDFRWRSLGWTQARGAYMIWVGHDIVALESQLDATNKHVAALEAQIKALQDAPPPAPPQPGPAEQAAMKAIQAYITFQAAQKAMQDAMQAAAGEQ